MNLSTLSDKRLLRLAVRLDRRIRNAFRGGLQYGYDMATVRVVFPDYATIADALRKEYRRRVVSGTWTL